MHLPAIMISIRMEEI